MFGSPETTTGGNALKFYASQRLDIRKIGTITEGDNAVGSRHRVKIKKNKVAPPFKIAEFEMDDNGISRTGDVIEIGVQEGVLSKAGSFYKYNGEVLAQGKEATKVHLEENKDLMKKLEKEIWEAIKSKSQD